MPDFYNIRFPEKIKYGSTGGPSYYARELRAPSQNEQIITLTDRARLEWTFESQAWTPELLSQLLDFWHVIGGVGIGFRFRDWSDWYVGMSWVLDVLTHTAALAHEFAEGDGATVAFQLERVRSFGAYSKRIKITRPVASTVKLYSWNGSAWVEIASGFTVNYDTGVVTFDVAPADNLRLAWGGLYDYPVRFAVSNPNLTLSQMQKGIMTGLKVISLKE